MQIATSNNVSEIPVVGLSKDAAHGIFSSATALAIDLLDCSVAFFSTAHEQDNYRFLGAPTLAPWTTGPCAGLIDIACRRVAQTNKALASSDFRRFATAAALDLPGGAPACAFLGVPTYQHDGQFIGVLGVCNEGARVWTNRDLEKLYLVSRMVSDKIAVRSLKHFNEEFSENIFDAKRRFLAFADQIPGALFQYTLHPDGSDSIQYANQGCSRLWELSDGEINGDPSRLWALTLPEDVDAMKKSVAASAENLTPWGHRWRVRTPSGAIKWLQGRGQPSRTKEGAIVWNSVVLDVTELAEQERALERAKAQAEYEASHDALTGLPNRRCLDQTLKKLTSESSEYKNLVYSIIHIDLDDFKYVNDTLGHSIGDQVLCQFSQKITEIAAENYVIARAGGDEFIVILRHNPGDDIAKRLSSRFQKAFSEAIFIDGERLRVTASIGVATTDADTLSDLLVRADLALQKAKDLGKNGVELFSPALKEEVRQRRTLSEEVLQGLRDGEFFPVFQPQICCETGRLVGMEALARWRHPARGALSPAAFLSSAERLGVVDQIDRAVFLQAMDACDALGEAGLHIPKMSVNVSAERLRGDQAFNDFLERRPKHAKVAFELLETVYFDDDREDLRWSIDRFREAGVDVEIDDFGSGRASVIALFKIRPDRLKIDRNLIIPTVKSTEHRRLVEKIVEMAQSLDIRVTAEGVETAEHVNILRALGCDALQGYHLARPMTEEALTAYLKAAA